MPPKLQLLAVVAFAVAMLFLENQIQKLEESRSKLGEEQNHSGLREWCGRGRAREALQPEQVAFVGPGVWLGGRRLKRDCRENWDWGYREHQLHERCELNLNGVLGSRGHGTACKVGLFGTKRLSRDRHSMGREQGNTELGGERVLLEETETLSLCVLSEVVQKTPAMSGEGYSNLRYGHLDTESFGDGEVRQGIDAQKWREDLGMMVSREIHCSELHSCTGFSKGPQQLTGEIGIGYPVRTGMHIKRFNKILKRGTQAFKLNFSGAKLINILGLR